MRMTDTPGEKLFIDFSADKPSWIDPTIGEVFQSELYVAVRGGSFYTFACGQKVNEFFSKLRYIH